MKTRTRVYAASVLPYALWSLNDRLAGHPVAKIALVVAYIIAVELLARKRKRTNICTCPETDHDPGCPAADSASPSSTPEQRV